MKISRQSFDWLQTSHITWNAWYPQCRLSGRISKLFNELWTF